MKNTMKTMTEKRYFEWHEDDVAVTLRHKGGSYGGGLKYWLFTKQGITAVGSSPE